jgi:hypothetical protein
MRQRPRDVPVLIALLALAASPALAAAPDWGAVAGVKEVKVLSTNEDGSPRETTVWLVVVDGQGYIRTSRSTRWGGNVERQPDISLRIEGTEYPLRAVFVTDAALRERVIAAFREKYGWIDGAMNFIRGSDPRIMRLDPR